MYLRFRAISQVCGFPTLQEPLNGPFLNGLFPGDFREGKWPIKAFGETAHQGQKTAH